LRLSLGNQNHRRTSTSHDLPQAKPRRVQQGLGALAIDGETPQCNLSRYHQVGRCTP
jgi:hypothetical protein